MILIPRLDPSTAKKKERGERRLYPAGLVEALEGGWRRGDDDGTAAIGGDFCLG